MIGNVGTLFFIIAHGAWRETLRQETTGRRIQRALALLCDISSMLRDVCFVIPLYCLSVLRYIALQPARGRLGHTHYKLRREFGADSRPYQSIPTFLLGLLHQLGQQARNFLTSSFWRLLCSVFYPVFGQRHVRIVRDVRYGPGPRNFLDVYVPAGNGSISDSHSPPQPPCPSTPSPSSPHITPHNAPHITPDDTSTLLSSWLTASQSSASEPCSARTGLHNTFPGAHTSSAYISSTCTSSSNELCDHAVHDELHKSEESECECAPLKPSDAQSGRSVLFYVHGGVWMAGDKMAFSDVAIRAVSEGHLAVVVQYPLVPQVSICEQVSEVCAALSWTMDHIGEYGGNPDRIFLCGHSSGANVCATILWRRLCSSLIQRSKQSHLPARAAAAAAVGGGGSVAARDGLAVPAAAAAAAVAGERLISAGEAKRFLFLSSCPSTPPADDDEEASAAAAVAILTDASYQPDSGSGNVQGQEQTGGGGGEGGRGGGGGTAYDEYPCSSSYPPSPPEPLSSQLDPPSSSSSSLSGMYSLSESSLSLSLSSSSSLTDSSPPYRSSAVLAADNEPHKIALQHRCTLQASPSDTALTRFNLRSTSHATPPPPSTSALTNKDSNRGSYTLDPSDCHEDSCPTVCDLIPPENGVLLPCGRQSSDRDCLLLGLDLRPPPTLCNAAPDMRQPHSFIGLAGVYDIGRQVDSDAALGRSPLSPIPYGLPSLTALASSSPALLFAALADVAGADVAGVDSYATGASGLLHTSAVVQSYRARKRGAKRCKVKCLPGMCSMGGGEHTGAPGTLISSREPLGKITANERDSSSREWHEGDVLHRKEGCASGGNISNDCKACRLNACDWRNGRVDMTLLNGEVEEDEPETSQQDRESCTPDIEGSAESWCREMESWYQMTRCCSSEPEAGRGSSGYCVSGRSLCSSCCACRCGRSSGSNSSRCINSHGSSGSSGSRSSSRKRGSSNVSHCPCVGLGTTSGEDGDDSSEGEVESFTSLEADCFKGTGSHFCDGDIEYDGASSLLTSWTSTNQSLSLLAEHLPVIFHPRMSIPPRPISAVDLASLLPRRMILHCSDSDSLMRNRSSASLAAAAARLGVQSEVVTHKNVQHEAFPLCSPHRLGSTSRTHIDYVFDAMR